MIEVDIARHELRALITGETSRLGDDERRKTHPDLRLTKIYDQDPTRLETAGVAGEG